MLKSIEELKKKSYSFIKDFIENCTIEEKIDGYYVTMEILSKNNIIFSKSNHKQIERIDLILNEMWQVLLDDWKYFKMANESWFENHVGYKIHMFYLPVRTPILTEYKQNVKYIIDRIESPTESIYDIKSEMSGMSHISDFGIHFKEFIKKIDYKIEVVMSEIIKDDKKHNLNLTEVFQNLIDYDKSEIFATDIPEGYIIKNGKKYIYQITNNPDEIRSVEQEKSQYEFLLTDFIRFWNENDIYSLMNKDYIKSVCNLFNSYINTREKVSNMIEKNLTLESIQSPCIGKRFDIYYNNIPNEGTISLCRESELYKSIFRILLVNLQRYKKLEHCILMSKKNVDDWNMIVKTISNYCL